LEHGNNLPNNIVLTILDQLASCSVEQFKVVFMGYCRTVVTEMQLYLGKSNIEVRALQERNNFLAYERILDQANQQYQTMVDTHTWTAAGHDKPDPGGAPNMYMTQTEVNALVQQVMDKTLHGLKGGDGANGATPNPNGPESTANGNTSSNEWRLSPNGRTTHGNCGAGSGRGNGKCARKNTQQYGNVNWKLCPPLLGHPQSKTVDGQEYHWCSKCNDGKGRWSPTHGTNDHTGSKPSPNASPQVNTYESTGLYSQWSYESNMYEYDLSVSSSDVCPGCHVKLGNALPFSVY
jgi:hypothetical protein